jgi:hypothetical protein
VYIGAQKLLPVYKINAGVSLWGWGIVKEVDADIWVQNYIQSNVTSRMSLWDFAINIANALNNEFGGVIDQRMGLHIGGYDEKNGIRGPAFYHVHNGHYSLGFEKGKIVEYPGEDPPLREFRAHEDCPPKLYSAGEFPLTRNGDFSAFAFLYDNIKLTEILKLRGLEFPYPQDLETRGEFLRFWINTIIGIYRISNARSRILPQPATAGDASIGGPVTVLTISSNSIESFYSK